MAENEFDLPFVVVEFKDNLSQSPCWIAELKTLSSFVLIV